MKRERLADRDSSMDGAAATEIAYPERSGEPDCVYYMRNGLCGFGMNCRFNHPPSTRLDVTSPVSSKDEFSEKPGLPEFQGTAPVRNKEEFPERHGQPECLYFLKTGTCKFGASCKYHHPREKAASPRQQVQLNLAGLPMRMGEKECPYYTRAGSCKFGFNCKFHHPQPGAVSSVMPMSASTLYVPGSVPSFGAAPYQGGIPTWSVSRAAYLPGLRLPSPSSYMPIIFSPRAISMPRWTAYQGPISPVVPLEGLHQGLRTNFVYSTVQQKPDLAAGMQSVNSRASILPMACKENNFPERVGQPDCHYYLKTGDCKFGASCKFHHPKDKATSPLACTLSIIGLPLRPGQPPCTFYVRYGICKFGPTCKFDHPLGGLLYDSLPPSFYNMPVAPCTKVSSGAYFTVSSSEMLNETFKVQKLAAVSMEQASDASANGDSGPCSLLASGEVTPPEHVEK